jgi:hypothetical protein
MSQNAYVLIKWRTYFYNKQFLRKVRKVIFLSSISAIGTRKLRMCYNATDNNGIRLIFITKLSMLHFTEIWGILEMKRRYEEQMGKHFHSLYI